MKRDNYLIVFMLLIIISAPSAVSAYSISQDGLGFIAEHEGTEYNLYNDPAGQCTIGTGHLVHKGNCNGKDPGEQGFLNGITEDQALELLRSDVAVAEQAVNSQLIVPLTQSQYDALVDFAYNEGSGHLATMLSDCGLNQGHYDAVPQELNKWVYGRGQILPGLVTRRSDEGTLFQSGSTVVEENAKTNVNNELDRLEKAMSSYMSLSTLFTGSSRQSSAPALSFNYQTVGAKYCQSGADASDYMTSCGISESGIQDALYVISHLGLERTGFCIVIVDYSYSAFGTVESMKYPIVCNEKGEPYWQSWQLYGKLSQLLNNP